MSKSIALVLIGVFTTNACCYGLAPELRTAASEFKETYTAASICRSIEREGGLDGDSYLSAVLPKLESLKNSYRNISVTVSPHEIIIDIPDDEMAVRYFDPRAATVITPFSDISRLRTKVVNDRLLRQIIYRVKAIGEPSPSDPAAVNKPGVAVSRSSRAIPDTDEAAAAGPNLPEIIPPTAVPANAAADSAAADSATGADRHVEAVPVPAGAVSAYITGWVIAMTARLTRDMISGGAIDADAIRKSVEDALPEYVVSAVVNLRKVVNEAIAETALLMSAELKPEGPESRDASAERSLVNNVAQIKGAEWLDILTRIQSYRRQGYAEAQIMDLLSPKLRELALLSESDFGSLEEDAMRAYSDIVRREGDGVLKHGVAAAALQKPEAGSLLFCPDRNSKEFMALTQKGCRLKIAAGVSAGGLSMRSKEKIVASYRIQDDVGLIGGLTLWQVKETVLKYYKRLGSIVSKDPSYQIPVIIMVSPMRIRDTAVSLGVDEREMARAIHGKGYHTFHKDGERFYVFSQPVHYFIGRQGRPVEQADGTARFHPSGQWNFMRMLAISGVLADLKRNGIQYIFHSNITNLGARPEQAYAALLDAEIRKAEDERREAPVFLNLAVENIGEAGAYIFTAAFETGRKGPAIIEGRAFPEEIESEVALLTKGNERLTDADRRALSAVGVSDPLDVEAKKRVLSQKFPYYATGSFILSVDRALDKFSLPSGYDSTLSHEEIVRRVDAWTDRLGFTVQKRALFETTDTSQEGYQFERPYGLVTAFWPWVPLVVDRDSNGGTFKREEDFRDERKMTPLTRNLRSVFDEMRRPGLSELFSEEYGVFMPTKWMYHPERAGEILKGNFYDIAPTSVHLCPSLACNRRCYFCTFGGVKGSHREGDRRLIATAPADNRVMMMDYELLKKTIDDIKDAGIKAVIFSGAGEPLMHPHIVEAMEYCKAGDRSVDIALYTNGSLLTDESIERILDLEPVFIRVSLNDGSRELHRLVTGRDDFDAVWRNVEKLCRAKIRKGARTDIAIGFVANVVNMGDLEKLAVKLHGLAKELPGRGITSLQIRPTVNYESSKFFDPRRMGDIEKYLLGLYGEDEGRRYVESFKAYMYRDEQTPPWALRRIEDIVDRKVVPLLQGTGIELSFPRLKFSRLAEPNIKPFSVCLASPWVLDIWPNGDVIHCLEWCGTPGFEIGNIAQNSLREILTSERRRKVLAWVNEAVLCARCPAICAQYELNRVLADIREGIERGKGDDLARQAEEYVRGHPAPRHINFLYPASQPMSGFPDVEMVASFDGKGHAELRYPEGADGRLPEQYYNNLKEALGLLASGNAMIPKADIPLIIRGSMEQTAMISGGKCHLSASSLCAPAFFLHGLLYHDIFLHLMSGMDEYDALSETVRYLIHHPGSLDRTVAFLKNRSSPANIIREVFVPDTGPDGFPGIDTVFAVAFCKKDVLEAIDVLRDILDDERNPIFLRIRAAFWLYDAYSRQLARVDGRSAERDEKTSIYKDKDALYYYDKAFGLIKEKVKELAGKSAVLPDGRSLYAVTLKEYRHRIPGNAEMVELEQPVRIELTSGVGSDLLSQLLLNPDESGCCNFSVDVRDPSTGRIAPPCHIAIRVIDKPVIEIESVDLKVSEEIRGMDEIFDFSGGTGLIKAALVSSGLISPYFKDSNIALKDVLEKLTGSRDKGIRVTSDVRGVVLNSGLAGSATVGIGTVLAVLKICGLTDRPVFDDFTDNDKARAMALSIYAGCLMGDAGGVQDSCLMYPGIKNVFGRQNPGPAGNGIPGLSLPGIEILDVSPRMEDRIYDRVVLIDGGMRQASGDILRDQTASFFLGDEDVVLARARSSRIHKEQLTNLLSADIDEALDRAGRLEGEDWELRQFISPFSANEGIREALERLESHYAERYRSEEAQDRRKSFYFDSTGARGGAGGLFFLARWVDRKEFIDTAMRTFKEVHGWLKTPAHKDSAGKAYPAWAEREITEPYVYEWQLNRTGSAVRMRWSGQTGVDEARDTATRTIAKEKLRAAIIQNTVDDAIVVTARLPREPDLLVWDFDGVIADTAAISAETTGVIYWMIRNGLQDPGVFPDASDEIYREGVRLYYEYLPRPAAHMVIAQAIKAAGLKGKSLPKDYYSRFTAIRDEKLDRVLKTSPESALIPHARQFLEAVRRLRPGLECCINTTSDTAFFRKRFEALGLRRFFSFEHSLDPDDRKRGDLDRQKIDYLQKLIEDMGLSRGRVAIIDDSPDVIRLAKSRPASVHAIGLASDQKTGEELIDAGADIVLLNLRPTKNKLEALGLVETPDDARRLLVVGGGAERKDPPGDAAGRQAAFQTVKDMFTELDNDPGRPAGTLTKEGLKRKAASFCAKETHARNAFTRGVARALLPISETMPEGASRRSIGQASVGDCRIGGVNMSGPVDMTLRWKTRDDGSIGLADTRLEAGGGSVNISKSVANAGERFGLVSLCGSGAIGRMWLKDLEGEHVVSAFVRTGNDNKVNILNYVDGEPLELMTTLGEPLKHETVSRLLEELDGMLTEAVNMKYIAMTVGGGIVFDESPALYKAIIDIAHRHNVAVVADFKSAATEAEIMAVLAADRDKPVDILTPNLEELIAIGEKAGIMRGLSPETVSAADIKSVCSALIARHNILGIMVKMDKKGALLVLRDRAITAGPVTVDEVSHLGAGDAANAGLMLALADGKSWEEALTEAVVFGAACVSSEGSSAGTRGAIDKLRSQASAPRSEAIGIAVPVTDARTPNGIDDQYAYLAKTRTVFTDMLGADKPSTLVRVPVEAIEFVGLDNIKGFFAAFQAAPNGYIELYYMSGIGEVTEGAYRKYGLQNKPLPKDFKRTRENTVTLFPALKGEEMDRSTIASRLGGIDITPEDTILSPIGLQHDPAGLIRASILGLKMMDIARQIKEKGAGITKDQSFKDKIQSEILEQLKNVYDADDLKNVNLGPDDIIALAAGTINTIIAALKKLIRLLPVTPIDAEEQRRIYEHVKSVIIAA